MNKIKFICLVLLVFMGCSSLPNKVEHFEKDSNLKDNEVLVIGKIIFDPPLGDSFYNISDSRNCFPYEFKDKIHIWIDEKIQDPPTEKTYNSSMGFYFTNRIIARLNNDFYIKFKRKSFYILEMFILQECEYVNKGTRNLNTNKLIIPIRAMVKIKPNDKAVYIGTLKFDHNEFYSITKTTLIDDFEKVKKDFQKEFRNDIRVRKALLKEF